MCGDFATTGSVIVSHSSHDAAKSRRKPSVFAKLVVGKGYFPNFLRRTIHRQFAAN